MGWVLSKKIFFFFHSQIDKFQQLEDNVKTHNLRRESPPCIVIVTVLYFDNIVKVSVDGTVYFLFF